MSKMSGEESEVVSNQPGKEATEPYHGARPRATDFDRPVDIGLGGLEEDVELRDSEVPRITTDKSRLGHVDLADQHGDTAGRNRPNEWSPVAALEDTVSRMQRDLEELQTENRFLRTPRAPVPVPLVRQAALTTTKVPWLNGSTSWEQYQQVFDAIVLSNGWGDATVALQLLSHLQDDALSVALLVLMPLRASRRELTDIMNHRVDWQTTAENLIRQYGNGGKTLPISPLP